MDTTQDDRDSLPQSREPAYSEIAVSRASFDFLTTLGNGAYG
jgi:hypothetical protein